MVPGFCTYTLSRCTFGHICPAKHAPGQPARSTGPLAAGGRGRGAGCAAHDRRAAFGHRAQPNVLELLRGRREAALAVGDGVVLRVVGVERVHLLARAPVVLGALVDLGLREPRRAAAGPLPFLVYVVQVQDCARGRPSAKWVVWVWVCGWWCGGGGGGGRGMCGAQKVNTLGPEGWAAC